MRGKKSEIENLIRDLWRERDNKTVADAILTKLQKFHTPQADCTRNVYEIYLRGQDKRSYQLAMQTYRHQLDWHKRRRDY